MAALIGREGGYRVGIEAVGMTAAVITTLCGVPQAARILHTRDRRGTSRVTHTALARGIALWLAYGVLIGNPRVIAANAVTLVLIAAIVVEKLRFG